MLAETGSTKRSIAMAGQTVRSRVRATTAWSLPIATSQRLRGARPQTTGRRETSWSGAGPSFRPSSHCSHRCKWYWRWVELGGRAGSGQQAGGSSWGCASAPGSRMVKRLSYLTERGWFRRFIRAARIPTRGGLPAPCGMTSSSESGRLYPSSPNNALHHMSSGDRRRRSFQLVYDRELLDRNG
jgi:hypothetical protein